MEQNSLLEAAISTKGLDILDITSETAQNILELQVVAARERSYCIVSDDLIKEFSKHTPHGWDEHRITHKEFLGYLKYLHISFNTTVDAAKPDYLLHNSPTGFLLDTKILSILFNEGILQLTVDTLPIAILQAQASSIKSNTYNYRTQIEAAEWLNSIIYPILADAIHSNKIHLLPNSKDTELDKFPLTGLFMHEMDTMKAKKYSLWCDDKYTTRFGFADDRFLCFTNILNSLYSQDNTVLYSKFDKLFSCHLGNTLPSTAYLKNRLLLCKLDSESATLSESTALKNVRQTISATLLAQFCLSGEENESIGRSERHTYLFNLRELVCQLLLELWITKIEPLKTQATASWIMNNLVSLVYDEELNDCSLQHIQTWLVIAGLDFEPNCRHLYFKWLCSYLEPCWNATPEDEVAVAQFTVKYLFYSTSDNAIINHLRTLYASFPIRSFLYEIFHYPLVYDQIQFTTPLNLEPRERNSTQEERIDESLIEQAITGVIDAEAAVLDRVYHSPPTSAHLLQYLDATAKYSESFAPYGFLCALYWRVSNKEKLHVKRLFSLREYRDIQPH